MDKAGKGLTVSIVVTHDNRTESGINTISAYDKEFKVLKVFTKTLADLE